MTRGTLPIPLGDIPLDIVRPVALILLDTGKVKPPRKAQAFIDFLNRNDWIEAIPDCRIRTYQLTHDGRSHLWKTLCHCFGDDWDNNPEENHLQQREHFFRDVLVSPLPDVIHERVAQALWAQHSKDRKADHAHLPIQLKTCRNDILRLRTHANIRIHGKGWAIDTQADMQRFGEIILNERMFTGIQRIESPNSLSVMTIENIGAWDSCPLLNDLLTVFTPGNNTRLTICFLKQLNTFQWQHFGDLDYPGLEIGRKLAQQLNKPLSLFIPHWWSEYLSTHALTIADDDKKKLWPERPLSLSLLRQHPVLRKLQQNQSWLEQEAIMLDKRLTETLQASITRH